LRQRVRRVWISPRTIGPDTLDAKFDLASLREYPNLRELEFDWSSVKNFAAIDELRLEALWIWMDGPAPDLTAWKLDRLERLWLQGEVSAEWLAALERFPRLTRLYFGGREFTAAHAQALCRLKSLTRLEFGDDRFDPAAMRVLREHPALREIAVWGKAAALHWQRELPEVDVLLRPGGGFF
jgi:hypothetical protein